MDAAALTSLAQIPYLRSSSVPSPRLRSDLFKHVTVRRVIDDIRQKDQGHSPDSHNTSATPPNQPRHVPHTATTPPISAHMRYLREWTGERILPDMRYR